jgi:hypothetical protein
MFLVTHLVMLICASVIFYISGNSLEGKIDFLQRDRQQRLHSSANSLTAFLQLNRNQ